MKDLRESAGVSAIAAMTSECRAAPAIGGSTAGRAISKAGTGTPPADAGPFHLIYTDYRRYRASGAENAVSVIFFTQGFWASVVYRLSHSAAARVKLPGLRGIINAVFVVLAKLMEIITGISIGAATKVGPGLYIGHFGGIIIDSCCQIGENCNLSQGVTIGRGGRGESRGVPTIGNRVHLGANAVLLGNISVGDDAVVGPGAVVMTSVPPRGVAMGNPARVIGSAGSFDFVRYDGMETDAARLLARQG